MNWQSWLILAVVAAALIAAVVFAFKHRGKGCGGDCAHCAQSCQNRK